MVLTCLSPQNTGWSALHFSAERGDWDTTQALLQAGASPHLKDKVCGSSSNSNYLPSSPESLHPLLFDLSPFPVKNGLTALEIAEVMAEEGEEGRPRPGRFSGKRQDYNYEGVISLLRKHSREPSAIHSHNVSINLGIMHCMCNVPHFMCLHVTSFSGSPSPHTIFNIMTFEPPEWWRESLVYLQYKVTSGRHVFPFGLRSAMHECSGIHGACPFADGEWYLPREGPMGGNLPGGRLSSIASTHSTYGPAYYDPESQSSKI